MVPGYNSNYDLTQQTYILDSQLAGQELVSATFTTNGNTTLLLGITVQSVPEPSSLLLAGIGVAVAVLATIRGRRSLAAR